MAFGNVVVVSPASGMGMSKESVRPAISCAWDAGVGDYDVDYTWDDDPTFANGNGNRQTRNYTTITDLFHTGVPTSDLADLTVTWYVKASVTDTDAPTTLENTSEFDYFDPADSDRFFYQYINVGKVFDEVWETYLYQLTLPVDTQPCPTIYTMTPTTVGVGETVTLGGSFGWSTQLSRAGWVADSSEPGGGDPPSNTIDDDKATLTRFDNAVPIVGDWMSWDALSAVELSGINIYVGTAADDFHPEEFKIQGSDDDVVWDDVSTGLTTRPGAAGIPVDGIAFDFDPAEYRYWRLVVTTVGTATRWHIYEVEFYETQATNPAVRLYDTAEILPGYTSMTVISSSPSQIQFTVPGGSATGYIAVTNTEGTPCPGSNMKLLNITLTEPDENAGWRAEIWDLRNSAKEIIGLPSSTIRFTKLWNGVGSGTLTIPASYSRLREICDPPNDVSTLIKVYLHDLFAYAFFAEVLSDPYQDGDQILVTLSGAGMESIAGWGTVWPKDHPTNPSTVPDWKWSLESLFPPTFADDSTGLENGGGEEGNDDKGITEGWSAKGDATHTASVLEFSEGTKSIAVTPDGFHSGIEQSMTVIPGERYKFTAKVLETTAAGNRITLGISVDDDHTIHSTNSFIYSGYVLSELENVARNGGTPGCPGGATDGLWQYTEVEVTVGAEQESITVFVQADSHSYCAVGNTLFYVDEAEVTGFGVGVDPDWTPYSGPTVFELDSALERTPGNPSLKMTGVQYDGVRRRVSAIPGDSLVLRMYADTTGDWKMAVHDASDDSFIKSVVVSGAGGVWDEWLIEDIIVPASGEMFVYFTNYLGPASTAWLADPILLSGELPTTPGDIVLTLLAGIQGRTTIDWMVATNFDADLDSGGDPWVPTAVSMNFSPGVSFLDVLNKMVGIGIEWAIVPVNYVEGGEAGYELSLFNGIQDGGGLGIGTNYTDDVESPVLVHGGDILAGSAVQKVGTNVAYVSGAEGAWSQAAGDNVVALERRESYVTNTEIANLDTLGRVADKRVSAENLSSNSASITVPLDTRWKPFLDIKIGDTILVDFGSQVPRGWNRVAAISASFGEPDSSGYVVDVGRFVIDAAEVMEYAVARLIEQSPTDNLAPGTGAVASGVTVQAIVQVVDPGAHDHKPPVTGDLSGNLPEVKVRGIQGNAVADDDPTAGQLLVWSADLDTWQPSDAAVVPTLKLIPITVAGALEVSTGELRFPINNDSEITGMRMMINGAPTGSSVIGDLNINGTTAFTTQGNRPTIAAAANDSGAVTLPDIVSLSAGDYLTFDVDEIGSTLPGTNLVLAVEVT